VVGDELVVEGLDAYLYYHCGWLHLRWLKTFRRRGLSASPVG
jgi:hypothetical protein